MLRARFFELLSKFTGLFTGRRDDAEFANEVDLHLALEIEANQRKGMSEADAHRAARLSLGRTRLQLREELNEQRRPPIFESLLQDVRYGWRTLRKNPGFTLASALTLTLGIGANTIIFSVVNVVFLKPLPYPEPDRLVNVWQSDATRPGSTNILSAPNFLDWEAQNHVFESMALFDSAGKGYNLADGKDVEQVPGLRVSASLFPTLGIPPYLGRTFAREEEQQGKHHVVVLSYGLWKRRFGGDTALVGKTIRMDGSQYTVIGVMPPGFRFEFYSLVNELWVPVGFDAADRDRGSNSFGSCARLKPGVTIEQARTEMDLIGRRISAAYPDSNNAQTVAVTPMPELGVKRLQPTFVALFSLVGFLLLIACVNVANLMLARGAAREKEFALRRALGAGRERIIRQLLTEGIVLSALGALGGILAAWAGLRLLAQTLPQFVRVPLRNIDRIEMDLWVLGFTVALCVFTGVLFGIVSAYGVLHHRDTHAALKEGSGRGGTGRIGILRYVLVAAEVSLALAILVGAGLMLESMSRLMGVNPGLDPKNVLTMDVAMTQKVLYTSPPDKPTFCRELTEQIGSIPGVLSVGAISHLPIRGGNAGRAIILEGRPDPGLDNPPNGAYGLACPGFFKTMGIPLVAGREFQHQDTVVSLPVVVVNQAMVRQYWNGADPVGSRIKIGRYRSDSPWMTVVGVIRDIRHSGLDVEPYPHFYRPFTQAGWPSMTIVVKTASSPYGFATQVKQALLKVDQDRAASGVRTMEEVVERSTGSRKFPAMLFATFGVLALALAAVGITGVVGYSVAQRTQEIGIRVALGASTSDVLRMVLLRSMLWVLAGVILGLAASFGVTRLLTGLLFGVKPMDPSILAMAACILTLVALAASYIPAHKAARVDPILALRCD